VAASALSGAIRKQRGVKPGVPDQLILYRGKLIAIEMKSRNGKCSRSQRLVREAPLRAGAEWFECRLAVAAMLSLSEVGVKFRTLVREDGTTECWRQPELPEFALPKRNPQERRKRAPDYWEPGAAAEIAELAAASDDAASDDIADIKA
jgi:hypothetical protein